MFFLVLISFLLYTLYALFSFGLTDPNLVISTWPPYWKFQSWMWQTFFDHPLLLATTYTLLIVSMILLFLSLVGQLFRMKHPKKWLVVSVISAAVPLVFSYNALSHDVFNYMFNAKMILSYQANPHKQVALDFKEDLWVRFMHNTHTPAPYGYGWTVFSLLPYSLGFGKFLSTWLSFRFWSILSVVLLGCVLELIRKTQIFSAFESRPSSSLAIANLGIVLLHPLFLLEMISNAHNDVWVMTLALASLLLVGVVSRSAHQEKIRPSAFIGLTLLSFLLLLLSVSIKFATLLLLPVWLWVLLRSRLIKLIDQKKCQFSIVFSKS